MDINKESKEIPQSTSEYNRRKFLLSSVVLAVSLPNIVFGKKASASDFILNVTSPDKIFDVVVYGATPAGVSAAIAAARENKSVILIEPLGLVGGMMSGGLSFSDSNQMARESLGGIFEEIHLRIEKKSTRKKELNYPTMFQ